MSEYQYVYFAAVDRALDDEQLEFMRRQSTRAEVSRWEFSNEYHFGDFHGKADEMLRRGYDVHLHYANFGIRRLMFRLRSGLPWSKKVFDAYHVEYAIDFKRDNEGQVGTLCFSPEADAELRPIQFKRFRRRRRDDGGRRRAGAFRFTFAQPVYGPICLGHSSHFGMGLFPPSC